LIQLTVEKSVGIYQYCIRLQERKWETSLLLASDKKILKTLEENVKRVTYYVQIIYLFVRKGKFTFKTPLG